MVEEPRGVGTLKALALLLAGHVFQFPPSSRPANPSIKSRAGSPNKSTRPSGAASPPGGGRVTRRCRRGSTWRRFFLKPGHHENGRGPYPRRGWNLGRERRFSPQSKGLRRGSTGLLAAAWPPPLDCGENRRFRARTGLRQFQPHPRPPRDSASPVKTPQDWRTLHASGRPATLASVQGPPAWLDGPFSGGLAAALGLRRESPLSSAHRTPPVPTPPSASQRLRVPTQNPRGLAHSMSSELLIYRRR